MMHQMVERGYHHRRVMTVREYLRLIVLPGNPRLQGQFRDLVIVYLKIPSARFVNLEGWLRD